MSSDHLSQLPEDSKKLLEKPIMGGIAIPIAIVLLGVVIIFGISKMLSNNRNYKDLVSEIHSKTFGNRWVAAYELSKLISNKQIPQEDVPWLIENLSVIYSQSTDARTRNFIILALGSMQTKESLVTINKALNDSDDKVKFNAVVSIGNFTELTAEINWPLIESFLESSDLGLKQVAIYALAQHQRKTNEPAFEKLLENSDRGIRYAAAIALTNFKNLKNTYALREILELKSKNDPIFNDAQVEALKLNAINAIAKNNVSEQVKLVKDIALQDENPRLAIRAKEVLNLLKK